MIIDANTATREALIAIKGIGKELAEAIIRARPFNSLDDLISLPGIGQKSLKRLEKLGLVVLPASSTKRGTHPDTRSSGDTKIVAGNTIGILAKAVNKFIRSDIVKDAGMIRDLTVLQDSRSAHRRRVIRPDDLFVADFLFQNLELSSRPPIRMARRDASKAAYISMELQGQHFGEEVLIVGDLPNLMPDDISGILRNSPPPPPQVMGARLAYPSRIVVSMPASMMSIEFTLEKLLEAITTWPLNLDPLARTFPTEITSLSPANRIDIRRVDHDLLNRAVEMLRPSSTVLQAFLSGQEAGLLGQSIYRQAVRNAIVTVDGIRNNKPAAAEAREFAEKIRRNLASNRSIDTQTREAANALFEVALAEKVAEQAKTLDAIELTELIRISKLFFLLLGPHEPTDLVTALELPYRLLQSPHASTTFYHELNAKTLAGRTELWHTTLAKRTDSGPVPLGPEGAPITAMWTPDYSGINPVTNKDPFRMSLFPRHRDNLVRLMSGHLEQSTGGGRYFPKAATAYRLQLSAWGGVLEATGVWPIMPNGVGVEAWSHDMSYGRDEYVRVVEAGYLFPYGHRASLVTLTERKIENQNPTGYGAFLRQRQFIIVREPEKDFPAPGQVYGGRKLPFQKLTCLTRQTPNLQQATHPNSRIPDITGSLAFWPLSEVECQDVLFEFEAIDLAGQRSVFSSPVIFVSKPFIDTQAGQMYKIHAAWSGPTSSPNPRSQIAYAGQLVRMAPVADGKPGDVDVPIENIIFEGTTATGQRPPFHPAIRYADVKLRALESITGLRTSERAEYEAGIYLPQGYVNNPWKIFLNLSQPYKVKMGPDVPTDKVGGIGQPSQDISAISNGSGAVSGTVSALTTGSVDASDMFPEAKILGGFDLKDLIGPFIASAAGAIPGFKTEEFADRIVTSWEYKNNNVSSPIPGLVTGAGGNSALELGAKLTAWFTYPDPDLGFKDKDGNPRPDFGAGTNPGWKDPEAEATGKLTNFKLNFFGFVIVWFDEFSFKSTLKNKFDPNPKLHDDNPVVFGGPLEFVNKLSELIPSGGFSDPPIVKPSLTDLQVGYDFSLPNIAIGVFAIKNMKLGALLKIPFDGNPVALRFFFNTREAPFLLTVSLFGGGGFFALVTTADGVQEIEAALEFGAFAAFDVGVASGGVYVKGGVYFHWKTDAVELEGYVEMGGELSVLGLISVSVTLHLSLGYYKEGTTSQVRGQATLKIEVEVLFFSTSVSVQIERRFAGSEADPSFAELITDQSTWSRYCAAFA